MKPNPLVARFQDFLPGRLRQMETRRLGLAGLLVFTLALEALAVVLTIAGIPPRLRSWRARSATRHGLPVTRSPSRA